MSESLARELAGLIAREQLSILWPTFLAMLAIAFITTFVASYLGAYAKKRGENFATKADFSDLVEQLKLTTAVAEEVKATVSHSDWASRELKLLLRQKLEELVNAVHEVCAWQDTEYTAVIFDMGKNTFPSPITKVEVIVGLFLPELAQTTDKFCSDYRAILARIYTAASERVDAVDSAAKLAVSAKFAVDHHKLVSQQLLSVKAVQDQCRGVMQKLIGEQPQMAS